MPSGNSPSPSDGFADGSFGQDLRMLLFGMRQIGNIRDP
jgi:hypothetical protein